ncbi:MAG: 50S ribosomal protein L31 [Candidatus Gracilibacteria bacterium]
MKTDIHPKYNAQAKIVCANCSYEFPIGSTKEGIRVEICSKCHPFYTGKKVLIDTEGRVDRFRQKMAGAVGRDKKVRKKKTLEDKVNEELADQLSKEKAKEEKVKGAKEAKKASAKASLEA